jgi:hypothetical protein
VPALESHPGHANRTSYVIAPSGEIIYSYTAMNPDAHVDDTIGCRQEGAGPARQELTIPAEASGSLSGAKRAAGAQAGLRERKAAPREPPRSRPPSQQRCGAEHNVW